jgi:hypothetical protein
MEIEPLSEKHVSNHEVWNLLKSVEDMKDFTLIDTISEVSWVYENDDIDNVVFNYITKDILTEEGREQLIWYYILYNSEDYFNE